MAEQSPEFFLSADDQELPCVTAAAGRTPGWFTRGVVRASTEEDDSDVVIMPCVQAAESIEEGTMAQPIVVDWDSDHLTSSSQLELARAYVKKTPHLPNTDLRRKAKNWCFTWNNPTSRPEAWKGYSYLVYQREIAPETGTPHYQGYVQMAQRRSLTQMKKVEPRCHWAIALGSPEQNEKYCTKAESRDPTPDSGPWRFGAISRQGQRHDLENLASLIISGTNLREIAESHPTEFIRYNRGLQALVQFQPPPPIYDPEILVKLFIGPTGTGKTYSAAVDAPVPGAEVYLKPTGKWFDFYTGQEYCVLDDMAGSASEIKLVDLLRMLDKYRFQVEVKGSYTWFRRKVVVVTTNIHPMNWYSYDGRTEHYFALARRFSEVRVFRQLSTTMNGPKVIVIQPEDKVSWDLFWQGVCPSFMARPEGEKNRQLAEILAGQIASNPF